MPSDQSFEVFVILKNMVFISNQVRDSKLKILNYMTMNWFDYHSIIILGYKRGLESHLESKRDWIL